MGMLPDLFLACHIMFYNCSCSRSTNDTVVKWMTSDQEVINFRDITSTTDSVRPIDKQRTINNMYLCWISFAEVDYCISVYMLCFTRKCKITDHLYFIVSLTR